MRKNRLFQKVFVLVSHVEKSFSIDISGILFERGEKFIQMKIIFFTDLRVDNANFIIIFKNCHDESEKFLFQKLLPNPIVCECWFMFLFKLFSVQIKKRKVEDGLSVWRCGYVSHVMMLFINPIYFCHSFSFASLSGPSTKIHEISCWFYQSVKSIEKMLQEFESFGIAVFLVRAVAELTRKLSFSRLT